MNDDLPTDSAVPEGASQRRFIVFAHHIISERDRIRFGEDVFRRRGYQVQYISLWYLLGNTSNAGVETENFKSVRSLWQPTEHEEFLTFLDGLRPTDFVINLVGLWPDSHWLHLALARRRIRYTFLNLGKFPDLQLCGPWRLGDLRRSLTRAASNAFHLAHRLYARLRLIATVGPSYFMLDGPMIEIRGGVYQSPLSCMFPFPGRSRKIDAEGFELLWANRALANASRRLDGKYAVFLDGGITGLPDNVIWNLDYTKDPEPYFAELRKTFDKLERDHDIPIVIALHPKSSYSEAELRTAFAGRPTFINSTPELVRDAEFVLMHGSTSVSIAVAFRKPVLFLTSEIVRSTPDMYAVEYLASWFEQRTIDMNGADIERQEKIPIPTPTERIYGRYMRNFLKADNVKAPSTWEAVLDTFEEMTGQYSKAEEAFPAEALK